MGLARVVLPAVLVAILASAATAEAVFPGRNGHVFFTFAEGNHYEINLYAVRALNPRTGRVRTLYECRSWAYAPGGCFLGPPAVAPNGRELVLLGQTLGVGSYLLRMNMHGRSRRKVALATQEAPTATPYWDRDGRSVVYERRLDPAAPGQPVQRLFRLGLDGSELGPLGPEFETYPDVSAAGRIAATRIVTCGWTCSRSYVYAQRPGGRFRRVSDGPEDTQPAWSPHGKRIAFARARPEPPYRSDIYVVGSDGRGLRRLTWHGGWRPRWSPDGRYLLFVRKGKLHRLDLRRGRVRRYFTVEPDHVAVGDFSWARR